MDRPGSSVYFVRRMSSPTRHARLMELFDEACELPRPEVKAWLASLTGFDEGLRQELAAMLEVDGRSEVFKTREGAAVLAKDLLDTALARVPKLPGALGEVGAPAHVGEFEVLEKLGAGGMGSVYKARQQAPARIVALKTLHPWLVSAAALERFRFEAQALASLKHPGIPPVYAVGQHDGLVYFAMELVEGPPLAKFVLERKLDARAKVLLLAQVAEAVHHAHLRGLVHRDLKPDNVRVTAEGTPRVLDFGIAAGLGSRSTEVAGTPAYMSPEQFDPEAGVDVRTDVYALGVMLFELLTGEVPLKPHSPKLGTLRELKQQPAPRLAALAPGLGRELDAIVSRALEVRVERRYGSAAELAEELRRWLRHEPVQAVGGGALYRARCFVRRNRALSGALASLALALLVGAGVSTAFFLEARAAAKKAELEASRAKASAEFLANVFAEADSDNAGGRGATIGVAIDHAVEKLEAEPLDPHVEAFLRASLANTYVGLGEWQHAKAQALAAEQAYLQHGLPEDEQLSEVLRVVSEVQVETGAMKAGVEAAERSLGLEERLHGEAPHDHTSYSLHVAAIAHRFANDLEGSLALHRRAVAMERALEAATGHSFLTDALEQECLTLVTFGRYDEARPLVQESLGLTEKRFGRAHQVTAISLAHLGWLELNAGNFAAARPLFAEVNATRRKLLGPQHMRYAQGLHNAAHVELFDGKPEAAAAPLEEALAVAKKAFGEQTGRYAWLETLRGELLRQQGKPREALALLERDQRLIEADYGEERDAMVQVLVLKARAQKDAGLADDAAATKARALELCARIYRAERPLLRRLAEAL